MPTVSAQPGQQIRRYVLPYQYERYTWTVTGQPIPAPRLTAARKFDPRLSRDIPAPELVAELVADARAAVITRGYYAFKEAVRAGLLDAYPTDAILGRNTVLYGWPFRFDDVQAIPHAIMEYSLWMAKAKTGRCVHGDPDNVAKAINDALFGNDRHVLPRCLSMVCGDPRPRVLITVTLLNPD